MTMRGRLFEEKVQDEVDVDGFDGKEEKSNDLSM
jgi:hypothetical protein